MAVNPSAATAAQQLAGATIPGPLTVSGLITAKQARIVPGGAPVGVTGLETLILGAPVNQAAITAIIGDDPANARSVPSAHFLYVEDHNGAPIEATPPAGGPRAFGDYGGQVWTGTATPAVTGTPWDAWQWVGTGAGAFAGASFYSGDGAPLPASTVTKLGTFLQVANVGDFYWRRDTQQWYVCTVAGTGGARGGTWSAAVSVGGNLTVAGNITATFGSIDCSLAGTGFQCSEGANGKQGTAVLVAGSKVVANTSVTANSRILLTSQADGGAPGFLRVSARVAGTSFTITSSSGTDTSTVAYEIFEPG